MSALLQLAGVVSTALLLVNLGLGWGASLGAVSTTLHINVSFIATIAVLFSQAMTLFLLVGSSRRVRQVARERRLKDDLLDGLPDARAVLPVAALALPAVMAAFILGGGAHTGAVPPWVHGWLSVAAVALQSWSFLQEAGALQSLERVIQRVEEVVGR